MLDPVDIALYQHGVRLTQVQVLHRGLVAVSSPYSPHLGTPRTEMYEVLIRHATLLLDMLEIS